MFCCTIFLKIIKKDTLVKRKDIENHKENECAMKLLCCDDCQEHVLRKDMEHHLDEECLECEISCEYVNYGCDVKLKRKLMDEHLEKAKVSHLESKV